MFSKTLEHTTTIVILSAVVACVAIVSGYYILRPETQNLAASPATIMSLQESVTADGSIDSDQNVSLSFENNAMTGESVRATMPEIRTAPARVKANSRKRAPVRPP